MQTKLNIHKQAFGDMEKHSESEIQKLKAKKEPKEMQKESEFIKFKKNVF